MSGLREGKGLLDALRRTGDAEYVAERLAKREYPKGWEPGFDTEKGMLTFVSEKKPSEIDSEGFRVLIESAGLDPDVFTIDLDGTDFKLWTVTMKQVNPDTGFVTPIQVENYGYKLKVVRKAVPPDDIRNLVREVKRLRPLRTLPPAGDLSLVVCLSDWQLGKRDGDGTTGIVSRVMGRIPKILAHTNNLRSLGHEIGTLYLAGLGDLIEGCKGHYPMQAFNVELDRREQCKVARRLILEYVKALSPHFEKVVLVAVGGNHGENRTTTNEGGKAFTTFADNDDVAAFEIVWEILRENQPRFPNVSAVIPESELTLVLNVSGVTVGFTHGHLAGSGAGAEGATKVWNWWSKQAFGDTPVGDAQVLFSGHFHYLLVKRNGPRTHVQVPPEDGGSEWFAQASGLDTPPGTVVALVGSSLQYGGIDHIRVL